MTVIPGEEETLQSEKFSCQATGWGCLGFWIRAQIKQAFFPKSTLSFLSSTEVSKHNSKKIGGPFLCNPW